MVSRYDQFQGESEGHSTVYRRRLLPGLPPEWLQQDAASEKCGNGSKEFRIRQRRLKTGQNSRFSLSFFNAPVRTQKVPDLMP